MFTTRGALTKPSPAPTQEDPAMAIAVVNEFDAGADRTTSNYDEISKRLALDTNPPAGLIVHAAGFSSNTFRIISIWESAEQEQRFGRERLLPIVRDVVGESATPPRSDSYELHNIVTPR
jgi:hypothetical protein